MEKPDWSDAPDWAQYLAQTELGNWGWFEEKPDTTLGHWASNGRCSIAPIAKVKDWQNTLEERS